jgi:hypothetical protein
MAARAEEPADQRPKAFRARSLVLGFLLSIPAALISTHQPVDSMFSLLLAPVSILIFLVAFNNIWGRIIARGKGGPLSQADLIMIFAITSVAAACSAEWINVQHSAIQDLPIKKDAPVVRDQLLKYLPDWFVEKDDKYIKDVANGGRDMGYVLGQLPRLLPKYAAWGLLFMLMCGAMLCINSLMRGAWLKRERLAFPLVQLPIAMTENGGFGAMWRSKAMWIAFTVMFAIDILNGINYLYPNIPAIPVKMYVDIQQLFKEPPMSNMGSLPIAIYPFMAAVGLFVPSDLLFSMVVFFLLRKVTHVMLASYGIPQHTFSGTGNSPGPPFFDEQTWGGAFALFAGAMYMSRDYLKTVWGDIVSGARSEDGGITHRWAFIGMIACIAGVVIFAMQGDLPPGYMTLYFGVFLIFSIVLTRIRAQLGPPTHEFAYFGPSSLMYRVFGNRWITDKQGTWLSQVFITINRLHRTHPMPYQLEAMKMGSNERLNQRTIFWAVLAATAVGFFCGQFFAHAVEYRTGQVYRWQEGEAYLNTFLNNRHGPDVVGIAMTLFGFVFVVALDSIRFNYPGFPLHPAGYVLSMNFGVDYYWFGLLLALFVKNFVQRYYGMRGYDKLRSVALGILLAEYAAETIWAGTALITQQSTYTISFNDRSLGIQ